MGALGCRERAAVSLCRQAGLSQASLSSRCTSCHCCTADDPTHGGASTRKQRGLECLQFHFLSADTFHLFRVKKKFGVNILVFREGTTLLDGFIDFGRCGFEVLRGHLPFGWMSSGLKRAVKGIKADVTNLPGPMSSAVLVVVLTEMPSWSILVQPGPARSSLAALVTSPGVKGHVSHRGISASPRAAAPLSGDVTGRLPEHRLHSRRPGAALQTSRLHGNCSLRPCGCLS